MERATAAARGNLWGQRSALSLEPLLAQLLGFSKDWQLAYWRVLWMAKMTVSLMEYPKEQRSALSLALSLAKQMELQLAQPTETEMGC